MAQSATCQVSLQHQKPTGVHSSSLEAVSEPEKKSCSSHVLASQLASAVSTTVFYPFDTLRIRYMSQDGTVQRQHNGRTYRSICRAIGVIWKEEGPRALFRGCHVAVLGTVVAWGVYMFVYRGLCDMFLSSQQKEVRDNFMLRAALSSVASCSCAVVCNPIWLLKTRMQIEELAARKTSTVTGSVVCNAKHYSSFISGFLHAIKSDGVLSLWRGTTAQVLLGLPNALNFPAYEALRSLWLQRTKRENLHSYEACICSTFSKTAVSIIGYPLYVVKTRMQDQRSRHGDLKYVSFIQSTSIVLQTQGVAGLYRGILPSLLHSVPRLALMFVLYEKLMQKDIF